MPIVCWQSVKLFISEVGGIHYYHWALKGLLSALMM
jgi:hypothetical protein